MESYEKKYKEALERAKEIKSKILYSHLSTESCKAVSEYIDTIIPELTESEDERVRKELIKFFSSQIVKVIRGIPIKDILAYLEKQKEQKPNIEICPHSTKSKSYKENGYPIENCDYGLEIALSILEKTLGKVQGYQSDDGIREHQTAIKAVKDVMKEQKSEQSEMEKEYVRTLHSLIADFLRGKQEIDKEYYQKIWDWLDNRHIEQKLTEPSDEELQRHQDELYDFKVFVTKQAREHHISFVHDFEWNNFCAELLSYFNENKKPAEWNEDYREEDIQTRFAFYTYKDELGVLYLSNVFVEETSRNHGFGTRILKAAEKAAEAIGATTISLKVKQDSPANAWYRKHGYGYVAFEDGYDWLEKNLEYMKPNKQDWSEEDETRLTNILIMLKEYAIHHYSKDDVSKSVDWLKSLPKRINLPQKQEWSDSFEENIRNLLHDKLTGHSEDGAMTWTTLIDDKTLKDIVNGIWFYVGKEALKYPNKELDVSEWSEEDEKIANEIEEELWYPGDFPDYPSKEESELYDDCQRRLDWFKNRLKSLRPQPQWKPSEEQLKALQMVKDSHCFMYQQERMAIETLLKELTSL